MTVRAPAVPARELPVTDRRRAEALATAQYEALLSLLRSLDAADWGRPTECAGWSVRDMVSHVVGLMDEAVRVRVMLRHIVTAKRRYPAANLLDGTNAVQIDDRRQHSEVELLAEFNRLAPRAVRARRRVPTPIRRTKPPAGFAMPSEVTFGHVLDVVLVRDIFMHRVDIARACGRDVVSIESDGEVIAQAVRDLDRRWAGPPLALDLLGAGRWNLGEGVPVATARVEAVGFARVLSGRSGDLNFDITGDRAIETALRKARIPF